MRLILGLILVNVRAAEAHKYWDKIELIEILTQYFSFLILPNHSSSLYTHICEMFGFSLSQNTGYPDSCSSHLSSVPPSKFQNNISARPQLLPFK